MSVLSYLKFTNSYYNDILKESTRMLVQSKLFMKKFTSIIYEQIYF